MKFKISPPNEKFGDKSYGEWAAEWWNWLMSDNPDSYDINDAVIFLRANIDYIYIDKNKRIRRQSGNHYDRTGQRGIKIHEDTGIFFPVIECEFNDGDLNPETGGKIQTEEEMRILARKDIDSGWKIGATIRVREGSSQPIVNDLRYYRAVSPLFKLVVSEKNNLRHSMEDELEPGIYNAVTDGYWILLSSLPCSTNPYEIHFEATHRDYRYSATYEIIVKP
jgi:hypothetical protein